MKKYRPLVGITMGDPVGIGPEIILLALADPLIYKLCRPLVIGDMERLKVLKSKLGFNAVEEPRSGVYQCGWVDVVSTFKLDTDQIFWAQPTALTGKAMINYVTSAIDIALQGRIDAMVTCPINKQAMHMAGFFYNGHTEILAEKTKSAGFAMMLAGEKLRVVLVTIHIPLKDVPHALSQEKILQTITLTDSFLRTRMGVENPKIAVAGLNPHAGEGGMFGDEEQRFILPAVNLAKGQALDVHGPYPPDTIFYHAQKGLYDAVICMYHDQGLIPFKIIHFTDGVNTTLGLPIIRTSVDHGTAYDIAGKGKADPGSLTAAIKMAAAQAAFAGKKF
ncbi:MAG: 4-hydroxythreonine-4-phosphate dehydrogenase PdxA [Thermodesulfobacteriota bacterium]|nr:4-hydroxythreonine-4-phosphate dehydrogenase PdxA [Thermodesulfobacteriota bacterium]